ncbi:hypothetical protein M104_5159 [Bacteroides fragilis str. 1007-1-F |uniref:Uncharacterized protein n=2 Tax=Bacteroides fragilis TaxID=817 RepID=A0AAN4MUA3_BACFG|nr:hypothetical protein M101_5231 [Bacteroides fragilis str. 1007-1-F \
MFPVSAKNIFYFHFWKVKLQMDGRRIKNNRFTLLEENMNI